MTQRRAVTLLELLIAIGLLVALTAIAAPSLMGQLSERRFDAMVDAVTQQLLLARAEAQMTGRPVEVRAVTGRPAAAGRIGSPGDDGAARPVDDRHDQWQVQARLLHLELPDGVLAESNISAPSGEAEARDPTIYESWARQQLPKGYAVVDQRPEWLDEPSSTDGGAFGDDAGVADVRPRMQPGGDQSSIRVAIFLPDGAALLGETTWLVDEDDQRAAAINVNAWTGLPTVQRVEPPEALRFADEDETEDGKSDDEAERDRDQFEDDALSAERDDGSATQPAGSDDDHRDPSTSGSADAGDHNSGTNEEMSDNDDDSS